MTGLSIDNGGGENTVNKAHWRFKKYRNDVRAGTNNKALVGMYLGLRNTRSVAQATNSINKILHKYPFETFRTGHFTPSQLENWWDFTPVYIHDRRTKLHEQAGRSAVYSTIIYILGRTLGHPQVDLLHFDQVDFVPHGATTWSEQVTTLSGIKQLANDGYNVGVSINFGGWNLVGNNPGGMNPYAVMDDIAAMCNYCGMERMPNPAVSGIFSNDDNMTTMIDRIRYLMQKGVVMQFQASPQSLDSGDCFQYQITAQQETKLGFDRFFGRNLNAQEGHTKLLLTLDKTPSFYPFPKSAPWGRIWLGQKVNGVDTAVPGLPFELPAANGLAALPAIGSVDENNVPYQGGDTKQILLFHQLSDLKEVLNAGASGSTILWPNLVGKTLYDLTSYEALQAAMLLFAATSTTIRSGVHYSPQQLHPGNLKELVTGLPVYDQDDWRKWGKKLQNPLWANPAITTDASGKVTEVRRRFTGGDIVLRPQAGEVICDT